MSGNISRAANSNSWEYCLRCRTAAKEEKKNEVDPVSVRAKIGILNIASPQELFWHLFLRKTEVLREWS